MTLKRHGVLKEGDIPPVTPEGTTNLHSEAIRGAVNVVLNSERMASEANPEAIHPGIKVTPYSILGAYRRKSVNLG